MLKSKHIVPVMVFAAVTGDGRLMPPSFGPTRLMIVTTEYLAIMKEILMPELEHEYNMKDITLVQDSKPAQTALQVQYLLKRKIPNLVPKRTWPLANRTSTPAITDYHA